MDFDNILEFIGDFGRFQINIYCFTGIIAIFAGIHMLSNVFIMALPKSRCFVENCDSRNSSMLEPWLNFTTAGSCEVYNQIANCSLPEFSKQDICDRQCYTNSTSPCSEWFYDKTEFLETSVTEWNLLCSDGWKVSTSESIFMVGTLVGSFLFGTVGDRYGRRMVFMIAPVLWSTSSLVTAFSNNWITYTVFKSISAATMSGIYATSFVVVVEFVGMSKRAWCGNVFQIIFAIGELFLALTAYFLRNWRILQIAISVPVFLFLAYPWLIPESVRWQLSNGHFMSAKNTIYRAAKCNGKTVPENMVQDLIEDAAEKRLRATESSGFTHILKSPILLGRSLNIFFNWTVNSLVYYGLSLSASNLGGNIYLNFTALAIVEIPAIILATLVQQRKGRKIVLFTVMCLGGISCICTVWVPAELSWIATVLAVFGKSNIAASFAVIYIYSAEIFPTSLRTTGIGVSSMCSRIGGIMAPLVANLGQYKPSLPMTIFGVSSILAGALALTLPETHNKKLPETVEEAERFGRRKTSSINSDESIVPLLYDNE